MGKYARTAPALPFCKQPPGPMRAIREDESQSSLPCGGATCIAVQAAQISSQIESLSSLVSGLGSHISSIADGYCQACWNGSQDPHTNAHVNMLEAQLGQYREAKWDLLGQLWSINPTCRIPVHLNIGPTPPQEASSAPGSSAMSPIVLTEPAWQHLPKPQHQELSPASEPSQTQTTSQNHLGQQDSAAQTSEMTTQMPYSNGFVESLMSGTLVSSPPSRTGTPPEDLPPPRPVYGDPQKAATASTGAYAPCYRPVDPRGLSHAETGGNTSSVQSQRWLEDTVASMLTSMIAEGHDPQDPRLQGWI